MAVSIEQIPTENLEAIFREIDKKRRENKKILAKHDEYIEKAVQDREVTEGEKLESLFCGFRIVDFYEALSKEIKKELTERGKS